MRPVPVTKKRRPNFGRASRFRPENQYGDDTRLAIPGLRGRLLPASIRRKFPRQSDALVAARLTDHRTHRDRDMWRIVTQTPDHLEAAGWASVEHPDLQTDEDCEARNDIVALVIEIISSMARERAYKVLYLRPVKVYGFENCFERVGVGRLFGGYFDVQYRDTQPEDIYG